ncbi:MAG: SurA N-terminal domain-containing protein [Actinomycetota bacterium]|nr:SurA N-terminal domain-containing protein [Actinomycetota bacterium]
MLGSRRTRRRRVLGAAAAFVAAMSMGGCGTDLQPGLAASVNGTPITEATIDDLVEAVCAFNEIERKNQGGAEASQLVQDLRSSLLESLVIVEITDQAAEERGVTVSDALIDKNSAGTPVPAELPDDQEELLLEFLRNRTEQTLQQGVIGANLEDPSVTTADSIKPSDVSAANSYLMDFAEKQDVEIAPRYGTWTGNRLEFGTGSLSDPVSTTAAPTPVPGQPPSTEATPTPPVSQRCG